MTRLRIDAFRPALLATPSLAVVLLLATFTAAFAVKDENDLDTPCDEADRVGWVGFAIADCDCSFQIDDGSGRVAWRFRSVPEIGDVDVRGPARGKLREGDRLFAIDSDHITTREAGRRLASPEPGEPLLITIERNGKKQDVRIVPRGLCDDDPRIAAQRTIGAVGTFPPEPTPPPTPELAPLPPVQPVPPTPPPSDIPDDFPPRGWFGVGLSCKDCSVTRDDDGSLVWRFRTPPTIYSVDDGGPADRARIQRGDVLTHVDDIRLVTTEGGHRFSSIRPGDRVRWTVKRDGQSKTYTLTAGGRPGRRPRELGESYRRELRELLRDLNKGNVYDLSREKIARLKELARELQDDPAETPRAYVLPAPAPRAQRSRHLRYAGSLGDSEIEVRGASPVTVSEDPSGDEITITAGDTTIRLRRKR